MKFLDIIQWGKKVIKSQPIAYEREVQRQALIQTNEKHQTWQKRYGICNEKWVKTPNTLWHKKYDR